MRVPDYVLKCVGFIGEQLSPDCDEESVDRVGTGFFVSVPSAIEGYKFYYFVTAKHVMKKLETSTTGFIVNKKPGGLKMLNASSVWVGHPTDPSVDVAVLPCEMSFDLDILSIGTRLFLTPEGMREKKIGIGDDVFAPGLFTFASGTGKRNTPILRYGTIAMLPEQPIQVDEGFAEVYLVEARSMGGISGSPVFVRKTVNLEAEDKNGMPTYMIGLSDESFLLGLMHGHWDIKESEMNQYHFVHDRQKGVNFGIAVVVPAHKILEVLSHPDLVQLRQKREEAFRTAVSPTQDSPIK